jgi:ribosome maturation factor RimP
MQAENQLETVKQLLVPLLEDDIFLVELKVKPINNYKIYLDADKGLGIEKCIKINRALYKRMEEMGLYPEGDFSLEVSSPGIEEPLKMHRQYLKNIGRSVEILLLNGTRKEGELVQVGEQQVSIKIIEGKGKKAVEQVVEIPFIEIKQTKVLIKF